jgi:hypothetical protein
MEIDIHLGDTQMILEVCQERGVLRNQAAYILATARWETNHTMKPVVEAYWLSEEWRKRNLRYYPWHGRGYVQLTWQRNYIKAGKVLGLDLTSDPNVALDPAIASQILVVGCMEGWFTGKRIPDYIDISKSGFEGARRVVNGTDKAREIAAIARQYDAALRVDGYGKIAPTAPPAIEAPEPARVLRASATPRSTAHHTKRTMKGQEMNMAPLARIIVRYVVGTALGTTTADAILGNPDIMTVVIMGVSAAVGAATEYAYAMAKKKGWAT